MNKLEHIRKYFRRAGSGVISHENYFDEGKWQSVGNALSSDSGAQFGELKACKYNSDEIKLRNGLVSKYRLLAVSKTIITPSMYGSVQEGYSWGLERQYFTEI